MTRRDRALTTMPLQDRAEAFVFLLARHERQITTYVLTLVPAVADAEDILQQAKVVMWRHFDNFTQGTNFLAWARKIAFHQILTFRRQRRRDPLEFSDAFLAAVAEDSEHRDPALAERDGRLVGCIGKLLPEHQEIVRLRYQDGLPVETLATRVNRTVAAVYRVLSRIRAHLHACVNQEASAEGMHAIEHEPS
jgi:RNA polymerase sigma-70 factor (ECF subfamily)